jgi:hypothetical protein
VKSSSFPLKIHLSLFKALHEFDVRDQFFGQSGTGIRFFVLVLPKNGTNMLNEDILRETTEVRKFSSTRSFNLIKQISTTYFTLSLIISLY